VARPNPTVNRTLRDKAAQRRSLDARGRFVSYEIREATLQDRDTLKTLIARSARQLGARDYTAEQIEGALRGAFGVDTQLIQDGTYFVVESEGQIIGCGAGVADARFLAVTATPRVALSSLTLVLSPEKYEPSSWPLSMHARESAQSFLNAAKMMLGHSGFCAWSLWLLCPV